MLLTTVTIDADQTMEAAMVRIELIADTTYVVVRRRIGLELHWYRFRAGFIREIGARYPEEKVVDALNLHESSAAPSIQLEDVDPERLRHGGGIVLEGDRALGVLTDDGAPAGRGSGAVADERVVTRSAFPSEGSQGIGLESLPRPGATRGSGRPPGPDDRIAASHPGSFPPLPMAPAPLPTAEEATAGASPETGPPPPSPAETTFSAFPKLSCPAQVAVGDPFDLVVALRAERQADTTGGEVVVETAAPEFDLVVQLVADGFTAGRVRDVLHVVRSDLSANEASFTLTAEPFEGEIRPAILQVDFSFGGTLCGRAWCAVAIVQTATATAAAPAQAPSGGTPILATDAEDAPDLTVTITENDDGTQLEWHFATPHPGVTIPDTVVRRRFKAHNAKSFAMQQIRTADQSIGAAAVGNRMSGIARTVANEIPPEAWQVLAAVWATVKAGNELPSLMLVSSDPYIPWELASTESAYIDSGLVDPSIPSILGAQVRVSRWVAPQPRGASAVLNPTLPPPARLDDGRMVLVIGDYLAMSGKRALPKAIEEGNMLAAKYRAVRLTATLEEVDPLFDGTLERDGEPVLPKVVHFACHGQIDPNPGFNGIVLNEGNTRLDTIYVAGNRMQRPFVFLNACQVGLATELLDDAGGMAAEFLKTGASGFVAPLWSVDDQVAQDTAVDFYREALDEDVPVAEVLRRRRARFDPDDPAPQTTHLAYVYYGHPRLVMSHSSD